MWPAEGPLGICFEGRKGERGTWRWDLVPGLDGRAGNGEAWHILEKGEDQRR